MADLALCTLDIPAIEQSGFSLLVQPKMRIIKVHIRESGDYSLLGKALDMALPAINRIEIKGDFALAGVAPGEYYVIAPLAGTEALADHLMSAMSLIISLVIDITHAKTVMLLSGDRAQDALAAHCPLNVSETAFLPLHCARSLFADVPLFLARIGPIRQFLMMVDQSMAKFQSIVSSKTTRF